ncbi:hypothetical protein N7495_006145 [Penicillium taxi]|uniref:uncharacterized protein n=1 Tax=Penicillium taxi TaxID=168475 RepID=UPI002545800B|nr:uncharacterized protein N7495_006145 [Penicillium taxi]KAJ5894454.1 hypothetical protein N7495_006145 [Penicillium taxi]
MPPKGDWLTRAPPENYIAGLGRGASAFTTSSDIGGTRDGPSAEEYQALIEQRARAVGVPTPAAYGNATRNTGKPAEKDEERFKDVEEDLFAQHKYDSSDEEADRVYAEVDEKMERRRKARREAREKEQQEERERQNPKIQQEFADLKRSLAVISEEEWQNLPDVGDLTGKNKRQRQFERQQRFYAVPDSVLAGAADSQGFNSEIAEDGTQDEDFQKNFSDMGLARDMVLKVRLAHAAGAEPMPENSINQGDYLSSLVKEEGSKVDIGDIKRARTLMEGVTSTNPTNPGGWMSYALLEEEAGRIAAARNVIKKGCKACPKNEDVWLYAIRLHDGHNAKVIAANAVQNNSQSAKLWLAAMKLEKDDRSKKNVLRQAILHVPQSIEIWKEAVNLEDNPEDARLMLAKAVEVVPSAVDLWLALVRLETPENARTVLNLARKANPTNHKLWIAAARFTEKMETFEKDNVMKHAVKSLVKEKGMPSRETWIAEAEICEEGGWELTCASIIAETLGVGMTEDVDRIQIWMEDAKSSIGRGMYETPRAIYSLALQNFPTLQPVWLAAADLERNHNKKERLWQVLERAVEACPSNVDLWLRFAKERMLAGDIDEARQVLTRAHTQLPENEDIWLASINLEADPKNPAKNPDEARRLLIKARQEAGTDRVWTKSVAFERTLGNINEALDLVNQGLKLYPKVDKLWMMKGQIYESLGKFPEAREAYGTGTRACSKSVPLWLLAARLEEKLGVAIRARSILDRARLAVPKSPEIWCECVRMERRAKNIPHAKTVMAMALKEIPTSGLLWSESIWHLDIRTQRKSRSLAAVKVADRDPMTLITVARLFWNERRFDKTKTWFEKAMALDSDYGDGWAWYYKYLKEYGTEAEQADLVSRCIAAEPKHGEVWQSISKDPANAFKSTEEILKIVTDTIN